VTLTINVESEVVGNSREEESESAGRFATLCLWRRKGLSRVGNTLAYTTPRRKHAIEHEPIHRSAGKQYALEHLSIGYGVALDRFRVTPAAPIIAGIAYMLLVNRVEHPSFPDAEELTGGVDHRVEVQSADRLTAALTRYVREYRIAAHAFEAYSFPAYQ
jgi:hypothetical protein